MTWKPEWTAAALEISQEYKTYPLIAKHLRERFPDKFFDGDAVRKWFAYNGYPLVRIDDGKSQEYRWPRVQKNLDMLWRKYQGAERIFVCSDLHIPHIDYKFAERAFNYACDCDVAIIGGDILNEDVFSKYNDEGGSFHTEYDEAVRILRQLSHAVSTILIYGNHDSRLPKNLNRSSDTALHQYEFLFRNGTANPIAALAEDTTCDYADNWWVQIEGVVVSHPERYSGVAVKNITNSIDYFYSHIVNRPWDTLCQGHSHQWGSGQHKGKYWYELGCMCNRLDYNTGASQTNPIWKQGFAVLRLKNGKLVPDKSRLYEGKTLL